jgi:hypothetical protein
MGNTPPHSPPPSEDFEKCVKEKGVNDILELVDAFGGPSGNLPRDTLLYGVYNPNDDVLEMLVSMGVKSMQDAKGNTPLHIAAKVNNLKKVRLLLDYSPTSKRIRNAKGRRPCDLTTNEDIREVLKDSEDESVGGGGCTIALVKGMCRTHHRREGIYTFIIGHKIYFVHPPTNTHQSLTSHSHLQSTPGAYRVFCIDTSSTRPVLTGPLESIPPNSKIGMMYILDEPTSADDMYNIASAFHLSPHFISKDYTASTLKSVFVKLKRGRSVPEEEAIEMLHRLHQTTLDKRAIESVVDTKTSTPTSSTSTSSSQLSLRTSMRTLPYASPSLSSQNFFFLNELRVTSKICGSDVGRTHIKRSMLYFAVCEGKDVLRSWWWKPTMRAMCIAFKSSTSTFRVFLVELAISEGGAYNMTISGPMADEGIMRDYPSISEVYALSNVSVDELLDLIKVVTLTHRPSAVGKIVSTEVADLISTIVDISKTMWSDPVSDTVNAKYLASKFQKTATESIDVRMKPSISSRNQ